MNLFIFSAFFWGIIFCRPCLPDTVKLGTTQVIGSTRTGLWFKRLLQVIGHGTLLLWYGGLLDIIGIQVSPFWILKTNNFQNLGPLSKLINSLMAILKHYFEVGRPGLLVIWDKPSYTLICKLKFRVKIMNNVCMTLLQHYCVLSLLFLHLHHHAYIKKNKKNIGVSLIWMWACWPYMLNVHKTMYIRRFKTHKYIRYNFLTWWSPHKLCIRPYSHPHIL
jgi:hypothetical protein